MCDVCVDYFSIDPVHPEASCADVLSAAAGTSTRSQYDQGNKFKSLKGNVRLQHKACKLFPSSLMQLFNSPSISAWHPSERNLKILLQISINSTTDIKT